MSSASRSLRVAGRAVEEKRRPAARMREGRDCRGVSKSVEKTWKRTYGGEERHGSGKRKLGMQTRFSPEYAGHVTSGCSALISHDIAAGRSSSAADNSPLIV